MYKGQFGDRSAFKKNNKKISHAHPGCDDLVMLVLNQPCDCSGFQFFFMFHMLALLVSEVSEVLHDFKVPPG